MRSLSDYIKQYRYHLRLEHVSTPKGESFDYASLDLEFGNHDDIFQFVEKIRGQGDVDENSARVRDLFWHHVFGVWSLMPLMIILLTAVVIAFPWAKTLLTGVGDSGKAREIKTVASAAPNGSPNLRLDLLLQQVMDDTDSWRSISVEITAEENQVVSFQIDKGSGRQPHKRRTLLLDAFTGDVVGSGGFADLPAARRAITWNRFMHTGESFGVLGQTIAGLASCAPLVMAWTVLAPFDPASLSPSLTRSSPADCYKPF